QTGKFDKEGTYIKQYLPELSDLPANFLGNESLLFQYSSAEYPKPIVDHKTSAQKALEYFKNIR
ncbi:MAG: FAD-binding domain-containing protein, partial [Sulfuricurvum sp.]|nr:FAD-binding domain-containing protein [Sulfuricurvum sp.]